MKQIVHVPHKALTSPAKPITKFDKKLKTLIAEMTDTLLATTNPKGVGLAAPQVGVSVRLFITQPKESEPVRAFINPEILSTSDETTDAEKERNGKLEGCLSIPRIWGNVRRAKKLTLRYQDETETEHTEEFSGFMAVIIQHETDHVNGILFAQRVLEQKGAFYQTAKDKDGKEILEEVELR